MAFQRVAAIADIPPGQVREVFVAGNTVAVCNVEGSIYAIDGVCPHLCGPLGHGALHGTTLVCPFHSWEFDCTTGINRMSGDFQQRVFPVRIEDGGIFVEAGIQTGR